MRFIIACRDAWQDTKAFRVECPEVRAWWRWPWQYGRSVYLFATGAWDRRVPFVVTPLGERVFRDLANGAA